MPVKRAGTEIKMDDYNYDENDNTINQQPQQTPPQQTPPQMQQPQEYRPMQPSYPGYYNMATAKTVGGYMPAQNQIPMN